MVLVVHPIYVNRHELIDAKRGYDVIYEILSNVCIPTKATDGSNGYDCYLNIDRLNIDVLGNKLKYTRGYTITKSTDIGNRLIIKPNGKVIIPLGFRLKLPANISADVIPKSGFGLRTDLFIPNSPGLVDTDYRGEVCVILVNMGKETIELVNHKPICQISFHERPIINFTHGFVDTDTVRGENGHGHSESAVAQSQS